MLLCEGTGWPDALNVRSLNSVSLTIMQAGATIYVSENHNHVAGVGRFVVVGLKLNSRSC
jgi:hypothetical protein